MNKLEKICEVKRQQLQKIKNINKYKNLEKVKLRGFLSNLKKVDSNKFPIIAEIKKKSPSKGILCKNFDELTAILNIYDKTFSRFGLQIPYGKTETSKSDRNLKNRQKWLMMVQKKAVLPSD